MSSPIFDSLKATIGEATDAAYKRGHLKARMEMLEALKTVNTKMIDPERLYAQIVALLGDIQTPAKAPKTRAKKVSA
jgi:2,3-bisphosphoglycerate-independent phosphoglycerate mutase